MKSRHPLQIGGEAVASERKLTVYNPFDGSALAEVSLAGPGDMERAVGAAAAAFEEYRLWEAYRRVDALRKIVIFLQDRRGELAETIVAEAGKPLALARGEVDRTVNTFMLAAEEAARIGGEVIPLDVQPDSAGRTGITSRFPLGPAAAVTPFNFPLNLVAHKVAPALACGNTVVLKPSPLAPLSSLILGEIVAAAGLPPGALNVVPADAEVSASLVADPRIRLVTFTGSASVGWKVRSRAGRKKVLLELGGNAAAVVEPDADLEYAAKRIALGSYAYAGQICISVQHILVHQEVFEDFRGLLVEAVRSLPSGDPRNPGTVVGPVISAEAADRIMEWVEEARAAGAELITGGRRRGTLVEPMLLQGTDASMKVGCREVFGPVATLDSYGDFGAALERVNSSCYGLQAGVFTKDLRRCFESFRSLEVGGVIINDYPTFRVDHMPYGGVKDSGLGREGVRYAIEEMTEPRLLVINHGL